MSRCYAAPKRLRLSFFISSKSKRRYIHILILHHVYICGNLLFDMCVYLCWANRIGSICIQPEAQYVMSFCMNFDIFNVGLNVKMEHITQLRNIVRPTYIHNVNNKHTQHKKTENIFSRKNRQHAFWTEPRMAYTAVTRFLTIPLFLSHRLSCSCRLHTHTYTFSSKQKETKNSVYIIK